MSTTNLDLIADLSSVALKELLRIQIHAGANSGWGMVYMMEA
jgi:hypothetical protein